MSEPVNLNGGNPAVTTGTAGVKSQVNGAAATASNLAAATGGIAGGNLVEPDIDQLLFQIKGDDTPLMQMMLLARKVKVESPVVEHYMFDEPRSRVVTIEAVAATNSQRAILPLGSGDQQIPRPYGTLLCKGVAGWTADGSKQDPNKELLLFVVDHDAATGNPIVYACNGPKTNTSDEYCTMPEIPAGTTIILLANALYETQKNVDPDLVIPQATQVYLQKRGMNQIVSDYFDSVKKRIPYSKALLAEAAITKFKTDGNRTLYAGQKSHFKVNTGKVGVQDIYTTEGVRYQVKKELRHIGKWTIEEFIALTKMVFTGEDVPKKVVCLSGKNFLENIQCMDYSKHPEIQISVDTNDYGWSVTKFHTVFGDIEFKHDPTLDRLGWANSALILAPDRLVHYQYSAEHTSKDRVDGEEATREALLVWDALALKGSCHIWVDGEGNDEATNATTYILWESDEAPAEPIEGAVYYLVNDCPGIAKQAMAGQVWQYADGKYTEFSGEIAAV